MSVPNHGGVPVLIAPSNYSTIHPTDLPHAQLQTSMDMIIVSTSGNSVLINDMYSTSHAAPLEDIVNDITDVDDVSIIDNVLNVQFSRPIVANGVQDMTLSGCVTFVVRDLLPFCYLSFVIVSIHVGEIV
jgi:hypothetical protein